MRETHVNIRWSSAAEIERLARYWTSAAPQERFRLLKASIEGHSEAPPIGQLQLAAILAEFEAGEAREG
jgi:hypothetical protein